MISTTIRVVHLSDLLNDWWSDSIHVVALPGVDSLYQFNFLCVQNFMIKDFFTVVYLENFEVLENQLILQKKQETVYI